MTWNKRTVLEAVGGMRPEDAMSILDSLVHDAASAQARAICDAGFECQVDYLAQRGVSHDQIASALGLKRDR